MHEEGKEVTCGLWNVRITKNVVFSLGRAFADMKVRIYVHSLISNSIFLPNDFA